MPTFPKPCTATVHWEGLRPSRFIAPMVVVMTPRPVASRRPSEPPMSSGLPVTTAVSVRLACIE